MVTPAAHRRAAAYLRSACEGHLREELLIEALFGSLPNAPAELDAFRQDCNEERPHAQLGWLTLVAYASAPCGRPAGSLRQARAPRPGLLHNIKLKALITQGLSLWLDAV